MYKPTEILDFLTAASRGKHLFAPRKPEWIRGVIRLIRGTRNRIDYRLTYTTANPIPKEFIRLEPWETQYLYMLASRSRVGILEIGRLKGGSTLLLGAANREVPIHSIDVAPKNDDYLRSIMDNLGVGHNVELIVGDSQTAKYNSVGQLDLLFIDGDHSREGCLNDLQNWWDSVVPGGHIVLHDCYFGNGVQDAVLEFVRSHDVRFVTSPYIVKEHRRYPNGSLCHMTKS
ncbi:MAG: class I SAM-dependent methyltransferase [Alphaproteobacteria bacterium]|nr:class I SAM-dependent methyltransferase [Alphaproteobacteria bacterium]